MSASCAGAGGELRALIGGEEASALEPGRRRKEGPGCPLPVLSSWGRRGGRAALLANRWAAGRRGPEEPLQGLASLSSVLPACSHLSHRAHHLPGSTVHPSISERQSVPRLSGSPGPSTPRPMLLRPQAMVVRCRLL